MRKSRNEQVSKEVDLYHDGRFDSWLRLNSLSTARKYSLFAQCSLDTVAWYCVNRPRMVKVETTRKRTHATFFAERLIAALIADSFGMTKTGLRGELNSLLR